VVRVETLVRRRTAELTRAIEGREAAERAARQHREERDQFSRLGILGEMASNIAHELNQPLAAITNYAEGITRVIDAGRIDPASSATARAASPARPSGPASSSAASAASCAARGQPRRARCQRVVRETLALFEGRPRCAVALTCGPAAAWPVAPTGSRSSRCCSTCCRTRWT
jgi:two-component system sensor histidine kinase TtrS